MKKLILVIGIVFLIGCSSTFKSEGIIDEIHEDRRGCAAYVMLDESENFVSINSGLSIWIDIPCDTYSAGDTLKIQGK